MAANLLVVRSTGSEGSSADQPLPVGMDVEDAAKILGVRTTATFDEIVSRKNKLVSEAGSDQERMMDIDAAYDVMLMQSMRKRLTGQGVSNQVRYADVAPEPPRRGKGASSGGKSLAMPNGVTLGVEAPKQELAVQQGAVFSALAVWCIVQAIVESPQAQLGDTGGFQLTLALLYSVYTFKENKRMGLGKAVGLSFGALVVGAIVGTVVANYLRVDIVPLGSFQSPGVLCTEFVIIAMLLGALFVV